MQILFLRLLELIQRSVNNQILSENYPYYSIILVYYIHYLRLSKLSRLFENYH